MTPTPSPPPRHRRIPLWLWFIAAMASVTALAVAIVGRDDGATLRAIAVSDAMSDDDARAAAESTAQAWVREYSEGRMPNLEALACPRPRTPSLTQELAAAERGDNQRIPRFVDFGTFTRNGSEWTLIALWPQNGVLLTFRVHDGELRLCDHGPPPPL